MKTFPSKLHVGNKDEFQTFYLTRCICYLRRDIFEHMLKRNENDYFALDNFSREYSIDKLSMDEMIVTILNELRELGWKCKTSFGGTGLFIYSSDEPPPSCHEDGL